MFEDLRDLTFDTEVDGELVRRTLGTKVREGRGWASVMVLFEERAADGSWRAPKLAVIRFRRAGEGWKKHAQVNLPADHVHALHALLAAHELTTDDSDDSGDA